MNKHEKTKDSKMVKMISSEKNLLKFKALLLIGLILILSGLSYSQSFVEPLENCGRLWSPKDHECIIIDMNGKLIKGIIITGGGNGSSIKWITVKDSTGLEIKIDAELIKTMKVKVSGMIKFIAQMENTKSIQEITSTDWNDIIDKEYLYYERALAPKKKKDKYRLYQLLNPGFDSKIKVFDDPYAAYSETRIGGINVLGGKDESYLFVKNNQKSFKVKKGDYKKQFVELYGDCSVMMEKFGGKKNKFKDLAGHVFVYDQACGNQ